MKTRNVVKAALVSGLALGLVISVTGCGKVDDEKKVCKPTVQVGVIPRGMSADLAQFKATMKSFSGGGAQDCGQVGLSLDPSSAMGCVLNASSGQKGFFVVIQQKDQKSTQSYYEAWVRTEYPSGYVEPRIMVYRQFANGEYSAQECIGAQPSTGAASDRRPFDCKGLVDKPEMVQALVEARGC